MSLYYEAASVLANAEHAGGSLKSRLYKQKDLKSSPAQLFALISEASKWSIVLKDVIEKCGLLREEKKVSTWKTVWKLALLILATRELVKTLLTISAHPHPCLTSLP